jgi:hypothetical protein
MRGPIWGFSMSRLGFAALCGLFLIVPAFASAEEMAPVALNSLSTVPGNAASAKLLDQNGHLLGQVLRIQADQDGKPAALAFRADHGGNTVVISAAAVSYNGNVLIASNDQPQIATLTGTRTATAE